jgi:hypothetical protein
MNMKHSTVVKIITAVASICGAVTAASAATCSSTLGPITTTDPQTGNSCTHNTNFSGSTAMCGGVAFSTTGTDVWAVQMGASQNFTFTVSSSDFHPEVALWSASCADNANCVNGTDYNSTNPTAPFTITTATYSGNAAGTYYSVITDSTAVGAQCGNYNLSFDGTLPVKLQKFSVK